MTTLTVGELVAMLADHNPETPVLIAHQRGRLLAVADVVHSGDVDLDDDDTVPYVWLIAAGRYLRRLPAAPDWLLDAAEVL
jgi:hypothetical protein